MSKYIHNGVIFMIKKLLLPTICLLILLSAVTCRAQTEYDGYIIKFKDTGISLFSDGSTLADTDDNLENMIPEWNMYTTDSLENIAEYEKAGLIESISPNVYFKLYTDHIFTPQDSHYKSQRTLPIINVGDAWNMGVFGEDVTIGLVDSGVAWHYDIADNVVAGYNYTSETDTADYTDTCDHGTCCASIMASIAGTGDLIGIAPKAKIVALKAFTALTGGKLSHIVQAIKDAVDVYNCDIINMSFGIYSNDPILKEAIDYASSKGAILVAAAGNDNTSMTSYPGGYDSVINVASVGLKQSERTPQTTDADSYRTKSSFSNYGTSISFVAPGAYVLCNNMYNPNGYNGRCYNGTSFSAPVVSAIAALCKSINPDLTHAEFEQLLIDTCEDLGTEGKDIYFGYGLVNAAACVDKLVKEKDIYISPITVINRKAFQIINNNTESEYAYTDIWQNGDIINMTTTLSPNSSRVYSGIKAKPTDILSHFIWERNLKPIHKSTINKATTP